MEPGARLFSLAAVIPVHLVVSVRAVVDTDGLGHLSPFEQEDDGVVGDLTADVREFDP